MDLHGLSFCIQIFDVLAILMSALKSSRNFWTNEMAVAMSTEHWNAAKLTFNLRPNYCNPCRPVFAWEILGRSYSSSHVSRASIWQESSMETRYEERPERPLNRMESCNVQIEPIGNSRWIQGWNSGQLQGAEPSRRDAIWGAICGIFFSTFGVRPTFMACENWTIINYHQLSFVTMRFWCPHCAFFPLYLSGPKTPAIGISIVRSVCAA